jgi:hypothetical protein
MPTIYGIDTTKEITPIMVRDAILECFFQAHCFDTGIKTEDSASTRNYCDQLVKKVFDSVGVNFANPTKDELLRVMKGLADFSKNFREPQVVISHFNEIKNLLDLIK